MSCSVAQRRATLRTVVLLTSVRRAPPRSFADRAVSPACAAFAARVAAAHAVEPYAVAVWAAALLCAVVVGLGLHRFA